MKYYNKYNPHIDGPTHCIRVIIYTMPMWPRQYLGLSKEYAILIVLMDVSTGAVETRILTCRTKKANKTKKQTGNRKLNRKSRGKVKEPQIFLQIFQQNKNSNGPTMTHGNLKIRRIA